MAYRLRERLLTCPYDKVHQIQPHRMAAHLIKCKKNHPDAEMKVCPFNATHVVPVQEFQSHIIQCIDRRPVERQLFEQQRPAQQASAQAAAVYRNTPPKVPAMCEEDWDSELVKESYNPTASIVYREFSRPPPPGLSSAARKAWRQREDERVRRLREGLSIDDLISEMGSSSKDDVGSTEKSIASPCSVGRGRRLPEAAGDAGGFSSSEGLYTNKPLRRPRIAANIFSSLAGSQNQGRAVDLKQDGQNVETSEPDPERAFIREKRKLQKKLREIENLTDRAENGETLNQEEKDKVAKKERIITQLNDMMASFSL